MSANNSQSMSPTIYMCLFNNLTDCTNRSLKAIVETGMWILAEDNGSIEDIAW